MFDDTKELNKSGFVEKIDVDRLEVTYNNLISEKEKISRLAGLTETVLKFQMGYKVADPIALTDSISSTDLNPITVNESQKTVYSLRPEYSLLETQQRLNMLTLKRYRLTAAPTIVGYGSFSEQAQRQKFNFFDAQQKWFPISIIGGTINMPIFGGGQNKYRIKQQDITILKTKNNIFQLEQAIDMEVNVASISYQNALTSLEAQRKNMALAKNVLEVSNKKYAEGVGSNLEIVTAQTALKEAETNYINALYDMYVAKIDYLKATGSLVK
jgi:outer membrane protein TolC